MALFGVKNGPFLGSFLTPFWDPFLEASGTYWAVPQESSPKRRPNRGVLAPSGQRG